MNIFFNFYVLISLFMYSLHRWLKWKEKIGGNTPALERMHEVVHNIGHLLRIVLVLLVYYLVYKSTTQSTLQSTA